MTIIVYSIRCIFMFLVVWLGLRIVGKKSIAQITTYDLAGILVMTTIGVEPLVYKIPSKATEGVLVLALCTVFLGKVSLSKKFYNVDQKPSVVIVHGKIDKEEMRKNNMNISFLISQLRLKNYFKIADVEYAIVEPNGQISVIQKSQQRPVTLKDLKLNAKYEGLALPLIIDGEIQYKNLKYANLGIQWLDDRVKKSGAGIENISIAELDSQGQLSISKYIDKQEGEQEVPPIF
ncbi:DUF421 domain-containing protein [Anaeromicropila populeti]|uniref:Uncharacterized membrane protein YcaP, DUF421 family n=1 Tax=Anaeromicropila populeti TaxID=37658 RepID=A0A1I6KAU2_9FIRM|nr:DUF421 domain-containing protein [Anaeromicropila populeti]SFR88264.1 Uncharacterized membrane protein YcaP, DUF421 family [Anaeromicropila populeti]